MTDEAAVILVRRDGAPVELQERGCLAFCEERGYRTDSIAFEPGDAAAVIEAGNAHIVVAAYRRSGDRAMERRAHAAGGRVEYARQPAGSRHAVSPGDLMAAMHECGATVEQIADLLGETTQRVSLTLSGVTQPTRK